MVPVLMNSTSRVLFVLRMISYEYDKLIRVICILTRGHLEMENSQENSRKASDYLDEAFGKANEAGSETSTSQPLGTKKRKTAKEEDRPLAGQFRIPKEKKTQNVKLGFKVRDGV
jgi:hypothetical protein